MSEHDLWEYIREGMKCKWEAQRHEDKYTSGIPDVSYSTNHHGWIELKYVGKKPFNPGTIVKIKHYTTQQRNWIKRHGKKGGKCFILLQIENTYLIYKWNKCDTIGTVNYQGHINNADKVWVGRINFNELLEVLNAR